MSHFERLDAACITAIGSGHMLPATKNGVPVDSSTSIPITWTLPEPGLAEGMGTAPSIPLVAAQSALADSKGSTNSAKVVLRLFISETGSIEGVKVDQSSGDARLDDAAVNGATGKTMVPATAHGRRIASCTTYSIVFHLNH